MAKLNYFRMLSYAKINRLTSADFAAVCKEYVKDVDAMAEKIIVKQWENLFGCQIAECLEDYGDWIYGSNLWNLYFEQRQDEPFEPEVEELILEKAKQETMVFSHLPHALSVKAEQKLMQLTTEYVLKGYNWPVLATSSSLLLQNETEVGSAADALRQAQVHHEELEALFYNIQSYLERFPLSKKVLNLLIDITTNAQKLNLPFFSYEHLQTALNTIAVAEKPNALIDVDTQLKLLDITVWNIAERKMHRPLLQSVLNYYFVLYPAPGEIVKKLLEMKEVEPLRELLSHSYLAVGKEAVLAEYPELNAEVLLADICREACLCNQTEAKKLSSKDFISLLTGKRPDTHPLLQKNVKLSMPVLCMRMSKTYADCYFDSAERYQVMQDAISYCKQSHFPTLEEYVPRLTEDAKDEKHRIYCL